MKLTRDYHLNRSTDFTLTDHVLIVDDNEIVADTLCHIFQKNGFEASAAYSANEGLMRARTIRPRLLLCDIAMPNWSGIDLMIEIGKVLPTCHIIMMTGQPDYLPKVDQQALRMRNEVWVVIKPFDPQELVQKAGSILRRSCPQTVQLRSDHASAVIQNEEEPQHSR
jgi:DNA-binding response OmpR family regulator